MSYESSLSTLYKDQTIISKIFFANLRSGTEKTQNFNQKFPILMFIAHRKRENSVILYEWHANKTLKQLRSAPETPLT